MKAENKNVDKASTDLKVKSADLEEKGMYINIF